ncbi:MAG TPA: flagellar motor switch protein FliN [Gemmatimonadales bacterium]|jgi:flagellar motor switch protein FliN/FliY|nr:flagellar motor switch protein FliN [Gemmatimonadales bacterium]
MTDLSAAAAEATAAMADPQLDELGQGAQRVGGATLDTLLDMMLPVRVEFGRTTMSMQDVLDLGPGSVIQLDRLVGEPIDIYVSDRRLAEGEVVVIGETFGIRITRIVTPARDGARATGR